MAAWEELGEEEQQELAGLFTGRLHHLVVRRQFVIVILITISIILTSSVSYSIIFINIIVSSILTDNLKQQVCHHHSHHRIHHYQQVLNYQHQHDSHLPLCPETCE